jgi:hypothetical protein
MPLGEGCEHFRQPGDHEILRRAEPDAAIQFRGRKQPVDPTVRLDRVACVIQQRVPIRIERDAMRVADQKMTIDRLFQPFDVLADGRLPEPELLRRQRETFELGDGDKRIQELRVYDFTTSLFTKCRFTTSRFTTSGFTAPRYT